MHLADAIEEWGLAHRTKMDDNDADLLRTVWATIRRSDAAELAIDQLTEDDSRAVMALFDRKHRRDVATVLNLVAQWSGTQARREIKRGLAGKPAARSFAAGGGAGRPASRAGASAAVAERDRPVDGAESEADAADARAKRKSRVRRKAARTALTVPTDDEVDGEAGYDLAEADELDDDDGRARDLPLLVPGDELEQKLFIDVDESSSADKKLAAGWYVAFVIIGLLTLVSIGVLVYFLFLV